MPINPEDIAEAKKVLISCAEVARQREAAGDLLSMNKPLKFAGFPETAETRIVFATAMAWGAMVEERGIGPSNITDEEVEQEMFKRGILNT